MMRESRRNAAVDAARGLNRASGMIAASVLFDSALEHYRGAFHNKAMFAPLAAATSSLLAGLHGGLDERSGAHKVRDGVYAAAAAVGLIGTVFHVYNIAKRPGGFSAQNFFYSAPIGAPAALVLSGAFGFLAERIRSEPEDASVIIAGFRPGLWALAASAVGLVGAAAEAALLHFRGAFQDPFMFLPVTIPPAAAAATALAALDPSPGARGIARWGLRATAAIGLIGAGFHAWGVHRQMGGWRNWRQNVLSGPPVPTPPSFTGLAMAGLAALELLEWTA
jgi:hypothetical protein